MKTTFKQLFIEFWVPVVGAVVWTFLHWYSGTGATSGWQKTTLGLVGAFAPAFFFFSFLTGQWFRVRKQQKVEGGLVSVETRLQGLLNTLEERTSELTGHLTGGDSYCYFQPIIGAEGILNLMAINGGRFRLEEIHARIVDIDLMTHLIDTSQHPLAGDQYINIGSLGPSRCTYFQAIKVFNGADSVRLNVFFNARNGNSTQSLRFVKVDGNWHSASRITTANGEVIDDIDPAFQGDPFA